MPATFQAVPNNIQTSGGLTNCKLVSSWNAYMCQNRYLGILLFESLDNDK